MSGKLKWNGSHGKIMEIFRQKVWDPCTETLKSSTLKSLSVRAKHIQPVNMSRYCIPSIYVTQIIHPGICLQMFCNVYCYVAKDMFYISLHALSHSHLAMQQCWRMCVCVCMCYCAFHRQWRTYPQKRHAFTHSNPHEENPELTKPIHAHRYQSPYRKQITLREIALKLQ